MRGYVFSQMRIPVCSLGPAEGDRRPGGRRGPGWAEAGLRVGGRSRPPDTLSDDGALDSTWWALL